MTDKLIASVEQRRSGARLIKLAGVLDGHNCLGELVEKVGAGTSLINLAGVESIDAIGARDWVNWVASMEAKGIQLMLIACSPAVVEQLNRVEGFAGNAVVKSFQEILDRSIVVTTFINALFACVIAFGVVYNGARIALSERGNELASLRVLGFTRREVAVLLLGEQGLITLVAIPLGFALGVLVCWLLALRLSTELYRIPLVLSSWTFAFAFSVVAAAALISGALVARRLGRLDLIAVLKTRE